MYLFFMNTALEKIKKLLRMKRGGTPAEIETALALAQQIAAKHGIDLNAVDPNDESARQPIMHMDALSAARIQFECQYAGLVCEQFFNVSVFAWTRWNGRRLVFVGTKSDLDIAIYVYNFLVGHFRRDWRTRRGRCRNRRAFMWGMYCGLCSKLRESQPEPTAEEALIVTGHAVRLRDYIAENFGEMTSHDVEPDTDAHAAKLHGWRAGKETNIRPAVEQSSQQSAFLLE
jgi:hypothetical protein